MFDTLLIANRGEIACRIIKTCQRLGITTVAVYSTADENAQHVRLADKAYWIGDAPSKESYLCIDKILAVAKQSNAKAIHPGYGFLSENPEFARACEAAGIIFVGPPAAAITAMGSKSMAKRIMGEANVPLIPGYHGDDQSESTLLKAALDIGFPVLLKASAGGGGKGMRVVREQKEFAEALLAAKREAMASFADDAMLVEKYVEAPRHIEIQLFADQKGHAVYLFERDCSIQRRHQKIIEEAPAANLDETLRNALGQAALKAAKAIHYTGAGTVEFLVDKHQQFYFMEMNTRLQVEHPVTEMITGLDLVEWQLRVAAGESLPLTQEQLKRQGHAIEVRICAEDPSQNFLPATGCLQVLKTPKTSPHVRIDSGVVQGDSICQFYDPMIAKLIVWDVDRESAIRRLSAALFAYEIVGVTTNIDYLLKIIQQPEFINAHIDTHFIETHELALRLAAPTPAFVFALAGLYLLKKEAAAPGVATDPYSPWQQHQGWRMNLTHHRQWLFRHDGNDTALTVTFSRDGYTMQWQKEHFTVSGQLLEEQQCIAIVNNEQFTFHAYQQGHMLYLFGQDFRNILSLQTVESDIQEGSLDDHAVRSPMPGTIVAVHVTPEQTVLRGARLMVVEAMKMEHTLHAPHDGIVKEIFFTVGDTVNEGAQLLVFETMDEE